MSNTQSEPVNFTKWFKSLDPGQKKPMKEYIIRLCLDKKEMKISIKEIENFINGKLPGEELRVAINEVLDVNFVYGKLKA